MKLAQKLLAENLKSFDSLFADSFKKDNSLLSTMLRRYLAINKGKYLRALLVMLSAKLCEGINDRTYHAACLAEYLHAATTIHKDVVDELYVRERSHSIKALWGNKLAVILGDYMLAKGFLASIEHNEVAFLKLLSTVVKLISEGELIEHEQGTYGSNMTEAIYFSIVDKKTASVFSLACSLGAYSTNSDDRQKMKLQQVGRNLGIAFQIKEDIYDYHKMMHTDKLVMKDWGEAQFTLPFIYAMKTLPKVKTKKLLSISSSPSHTNKETAEAVNLIVSSGGVDYASKAMLAYAEKAISHIQYFPESLNRLAFEDLIHYAVYGAS